MASSLQGRELGIPGHSQVWCCCILTSQSWRFFIQKKESIKEQAFATLRCKYTIICPFPSFRIRMVQMVTNNLDLIWIYNSLVKASPFHRESLELSTSLHFFNPCTKKNKKQNPKYNTTSTWFALLMLPFSSLVMDLLKYRKAAFNL